MSVVPVRSAEQQAEAWASYVTEIECLLCGRPICVVKHRAPMLKVRMADVVLVNLYGETVYRVTTVFQMWRRRCSQCGGAPLPGESRRLYSLGTVEWYDPDAPRRGRPPKVRVIQ